MSLPIKIFIALLLLGCAGLFVLKKPDGTPILSMNSLSPNITTLTFDAKKLMDSIIDVIQSSTSSITNAPAKKPQSSTEQITNAQPTIYRWKDSNGQWQFSDTPPINKTAETIHVSGDLNKDLVATYEPPQESLTEDDATNNEATPTESLIPMTISPSEVPKLMEDANNIQKLMDDRTDQLKQY
jgi:hypothetical protein